MASNRRILKQYVRYDGNGRLIPGGNILSRVKPKVGTWTEVDAYQCCNGSVGEFTVLDGDWYLTDIYAPPVVNGLINFPDHLNGACVLDPNLVGQVLPTSDVMMYINVNSFAGVNQPLLGTMAGRNGRIKLKQGTNFVTYSFTTEAMIDTGLIVYYDWMFGTSTISTLTVAESATSDFNTTDPIEISIALA